jgi:hypothetical protein
MPRLRFSLRAFLLLLFIASLIGSNLFTAVQLRELRDENAQLRMEIGRLVVTDRDKINVVAVPMYEDLTWRWRIYVPPGHSLYMCGATQDIPENGLAKNFGATSLGGGEYLLTTAIRRNREDKWQLTVASPDSSSGFAFAEEHTGWLTGSPGWSSTQVGISATEVFNPDEPVVLLRLRSMVTRPGGVSTSSDKPTEDGVMVFIKRP